MKINKIKGSTLFVVDDNKENLLVLDQYLSDLELKVVPLRSGEEILKLIQTRVPDMILLDIMMPGGIDGYETCRRLKKNEATKDIPVIFMSALTDTIDKVAGFNLGAVDYITKPIDTEELLSRIHTHLSITCLQKELFEMNAQLEEKVLIRTQKLRNSVLQLRNEITIRKKSEEERGELLYKMGERVKELRCINGVAETISDTTSLEQIIQDIVNLIPPSWQYPEITGGCITVDGKAYKTKKFKETKLMQKEDIQVNEKIIGKIEVCYLQQKPDEDEGPFLDEERNLIKNISKQLSEFITRKQAEEALRESDRMYRDLFKNAQEGIFQTKIDGSYISVNPALARMHGFDSPEELMNSRIDIAKQTYVYPQERDKFLSMMEKDGYVKGFEYEVKRKDGRKIWLYEDAIAVKNESGKILHFEGFVIDITERRKNEEQIKKLSQAVEQSPNPVVITDIKGNIEYVNLKFAEITGYSFDEVKGQNPRILKSGGKLPEEYKELWDTITKGKIWYGEFHNKKKNGDLYWEDATIGPIKNIKGEITHFIALKEDITKRKQVEEELNEERASLSRKVQERTVDLRRANAELAKVAKMKDEFLASMSHELRTPLNAVLGLSEALQEEVYGEMNQKQHKSLKSIEDSGRHLLSLINDILDIAKIEAGKVNLEINQVPIEGVCQASLRLVKQTALKKNIQLISNIKTSLLTFGADERRLKQILANLLSNAVKFTLEGGEVGIEVADDVDKERINFTVWDTGIGIAKESIDKLFQPFVQIDSSLTREFSGTGLGLSLVKHLTELHGGSITLESEPGEGSRFTITLPVREIMVVPAIKVEEGDEKPGKIMAEKPQEIIKRKALILIAEDNEKNIEMVSDYLLTKGYNLMIARNGKEAVKLAKERKPDLILMDIQMPGMDGLEATRIIRNDKDTKLAKVPVIALTALAMPGDKEKCLAAGVDDYIKKPAGLKYLVKKIEELLKP